MPLKAQLPKAPKKARRGGKKKRLKKKNANTKGDA